MDYLVWKKMALKLIKLRVVEIEANLNLNTLMSATTKTKLSKKLKSLLSIQSTLLATGHTAPSQEVIARIALILGINTNCRLVTALNSTCALDTNIVHYSRQRIAHYIGKRASDLQGRSISSLSYDHGTVYVTATPAKEIVATTSHDFELTGVARANPVLKINDSLVDSDLEIKLTPELVSAVPMQFKVYTEFTIDANITVTRGA